MLQILVAISQKFCCRTEAWGYAKVIHKKRERKEKRRVEKNNGYLDAYLKKEMNKIAPILLQMFLSLKKRDMFSRSIVELG